MLWNASEISGYKIEATDGSIGTVSDLLFQDATWTVRWVVVDTGNWLPGRKVLLPLSALGKPDPTRNQFPVKLTMQQVKDSPDLDTDRPVSRQQETRIYGYYGWNPYWDSGVMPMGGVMATSVVAPLSSGPRPAVGADLADADPHLRSLDEVVGYDIHATDGDIGHVEELLVDDSGWVIRYVAVDTRNWWPGKKVLISPRSVRSVNWDTGSVTLEVTRQKVKDSPAYDPAVMVDKAYDAKFLTYYGITWVEPDPPRRP